MITIAKVRRFSNRSWSIGWCRCLLYEQQFSLSMPCNSGHVHAKTGDYIITNNWHCQFHLSVCASLVAASLSFVSSTGQKYCFKGHSMAMKFSLYFILAYFLRFCCCFFSSFFFHGIFGCIRTVHLCTFFGVWNSIRSNCSISHVFFSLFLSVCFFFSSWWFILYHHKKKTWMS